MKAWDIIHEDGTTEPLDYEDTFLAIVADITRQFRAVGMSVKFARRKDPAG